MGKIIRAQRGGKGSPTYRSDTFRRLGEIKLPPATKESIMGEVVDILHDPGRGAPVAKVRYPDGRERLVLAPEGIKDGDQMNCRTS